MKINVIDWEGFLTIHNIEEVSQGFLELLQGNKFTVVISTNEPEKPMVRTSRVLSSRSVPVQVYNDHKESANLTVIFEKNQYCFWSTTVYGPKEEFFNPYVKFFCEQITITHRLYGKAVEYWIFALEH